MKSLTFKLRCFAFCFLLIVVCGSATLGQIGYVDILPDEAKIPYIQRLERVNTDLATDPSHEWSGRYRRDLSHTMWEYLDWAPSAGFAIGRETCSNGPRVWVNYGSASFVTGSLKLSPERNLESPNTLTLPATELVPVKWGLQHWLVPSDQLGLFAYAVNSRSGAEYELFFVKSDDQDILPRGLPDLPQPYKRLLGRPPIRAEVIEIGKSEDKWYPPMTINAGHHQGVIEGMYFWLVGVKGTYMQVLVTEVRDRTSTVRILMSGSSGEIPQEITPKRGLRLTNRMPASYNGDM